jgi:hypothetical protein
MLTISSILPSDKSINVPIDQSIQIVFSEPIDPFTITNGISLYTASDGIWTGSGLSKLDTQYTEVTNTSDDYNTVQFTYTISNNTLTIKPVSNLLEDKTYYLSIFPGTDFTKVISAKTFDAPVYTSAPSGTITIESSYTGTENGTYNLLFTANDTFDLSFNSIYVDSYTFNADEVLELDNISITLSGTFERDNEVDITVYKGIGISSLYKISFITNKYTIATPTSQKIDDYNYNGEAVFKVTNSIPENSSVNNSPCNPITIRFNTNLNQAQNLSDKISIKRTSLLDGKVKELNYKYKILNNTIKLYLVS